MSVKEKLENADKYKEKNKSWISLYLELTCDTFPSSLLTKKRKKNPYFSISLLNQQSTSVKLKGVTDIFPLGKIKTLQLVAKICFKLIQVSFHFRRRL